jgi:hypothetical protein
MLGLTSLGPMWVSRLSSCVVHRRLAFEGFGIPPGNNAHGFDISSLLAICMFRSSFHVVLIVAWILSPGPNNGRYVVRQMSIARFVGLEKCILLTMLIWRVDSAGTGSFHGLKRKHQFAYATCCHSIFLCQDCIIAGSSPKRTSWYIHYLSNHGITKKIEIACITVPSDGRGMVKFAQSVSSGVLGIAISSQRSTSSLTFASRSPHRMR